jgi:hypothetical protein
MLGRTSRNAGLCSQTVQSSQAGRQAVYFRQASSVEQTCNREEQVGTKGRAGRPAVQTRLAGTQGKKMNVEGRR